MLIRGKQSILLECINCNEAPDRSWSPLDTFLLAYSSVAGLHRDLVEEQNISFYIGLKLSSQQHR